MCQNLQYLMNQSGDCTLLGANVYVTKVGFTVMNSEVVQPIVTKAKSLIN